MYSAQRGAWSFFLRTSFICTSIHSLSIRSSVHPFIHLTHLLVYWVIHWFLSEKSQSIKLAIPRYKSSLQIILLNDFFSHLSPIAQLTTTIVFQTREKQARTKSAELLKKELQNEENLKSSEYLSKVSSKGTVSVFQWNCFTRIKTKQSILYLKRQLTLTEWRVFTLFKNDFT